MTRLVIALALLLAAFTLVVACGGGDGGSDGQETPSGTPDAEGSATPGAASPQAQLTPGFTPLPAPTVSAESGFSVTHVTSGYRTPGVSAPSAFYFYAEVRNEGSSSVELFSEKPDAPYARMVVYDSRDKELSTLSLFVCPQILGPGEDAIVALGGLFSEVQGIARYDLSFNSRETDEALPSEMKISNTESETAGTVTGTITNGSADTSFSAVASCCAFYDADGAILAIGIGAAEDSILNPGDAADFSCVANIGDDPDAVDEFRVWVSGIPRHF